MRNDDLELLYICIKSQDIESVYAPIDDKHLRMIPARFFKLQCPDCLIIRWSGTTTLEIVQCKKHHAENVQGCVIHFDIDVTAYQTYTGKILDELF